MNSLKGSRTEKNILTAFAGESQARNRYTYFASKAKEEGFIQISLIFSETADQEKEHAKRLFKFLEGGEAKVEAAFPAGVICTTSETWPRRRRVKTTSGRPCTPISPNRQGRGFSAVATVV